MRDLLFFSMFMGMAFLAVRHVHLGVMLWVWSALFPPNEYMFGFAATVPFNKIAVACTVIGLLTAKRRNISSDTILNVLLAFLVWLSLSYALSNTPGNWGDDLYQRFVKVVIAVFFIRFAATDRLRLHSILLAFCLALGIGAIAEGAKFVVSAGNHRAQGPSAWGDNNSTATVILMGMPILLYLRQYSENILFRQGCLIVFIASIVAVIGTFSRGGFIGLTILCLSMVVTSRHRAKVIVGLSLLLAIGYLLTPDQWFSRINSTTDAGSDSSFMQRVVQWKILTLMALDHPIFGGGLISNLYPPTWQTYAARLSSELTFIQTPPPDIPHASHSIYFQVLGENGFPGLILYLLFFLLAFRHANAIRRHAFGHPERAWAGDLATALRLSLLMYLVTGAALPIPYLEGAYLLVGCISALYWMQIGPGRSNKWAVAPLNPRPASGVN